MQIQIVVYVLSLDYSLFRVLIEQYHYWARPYRKTPSVAGLSANRGGENKKHEGYEDSPRSTRHDVVPEMAGYCLKNKASLKYNSYKA